MVVQQGRRKRRPEAYVIQHVEGLSEASTKLETIFSSL